jgi:LEA14-like dessication related protein
VEKMRIVTILIVSLNLFSCASGQLKPDDQAGDYQIPTFDFSGIKFENHGFDGLEIQFRFELVSKDDAMAKVEECSHELKLEEMESVSQSIRPELELVGRGKQVISTTIAVPWPKTKPELTEFLKRDTIAYEFIQTCKLEATGQQLSVTGSDSGTVQLPKMPTMKITGANAERFGKKDIRLNFEVTISNENSFNVKVDKIQYKVSVEDNKVLTEGTLPVAEVVTPSSETSYDISTEVMSGKASQEIMELVAKPSIDYHLEGMVFMGEFEIPVDGTGSINFPH